MRDAKAKLEKSAETLMENAEDCFDLAKAGHAQADKQHEIAATQHKVGDAADANADHLETLARALVDGAIELKGEIAIADILPAPQAPLKLPKVAH